MSMLLRVVSRKLSAMSMFTSHFFSPMWAYVLVNVIQTRVIPRLREDYCRRDIEGIVYGDTDTMYAWPSSIGHVGSHGNSRFAGPKNLTKAYAWTWSDPAWGQRFSSPGWGGAVIDDENNIYVAHNWFLVKLSADGRELWRYIPHAHCGLNWPPGRPEEVRFKQFPLAMMMNSCAIWGGAVFGQTERSTAFAVDMKTGRHLWSTQLRWSELPSEYGATNNAFTTVHDGVVIADAGVSVYGLAARDGEPLWEFQPDNPVWNNLASFPGDGTVLFQDMTGAAYRLGLRDGKLIWKSAAAGDFLTWNDGSAIVGQNNIVYAVGNKAHPMAGDTCSGALYRNLHDYGGWSNCFNHYWDGPPGSAAPFSDNGRLLAVSLSEGRVLWRKNFDKPTNNVPVVGNLSGQSSMSVVVPIGKQDIPNERHSVHTLAADTGKPQWVFEGPRQVGARQATGDLSVADQLSAQVSCVPNPWSAPVIDARGYVIIANQEGHIFQLRDANGDGKVDSTDPAEVDTHMPVNGLVAYCGSSSPAMGPGLLAIASCSDLQVFRWDPAEEAA